MNQLRNFLSPNIVIVVVYFFLLMALFWAHGVRIEFAHFKLWSIFLSTLFVVYLSSTIVQRLSGPPEGRESLLFFAGRKLARFASDWFPLVALVTIYENLREYTGVIRPDSIDATLYRLDLVLFGVEPTLWIQKFTHPLLTEYFAFTYSTYLVLPLTLGWLLYLMGKREEFHVLSTAIIICLCTGFLLFLLFPAGPPRFYLANLYEPKTLVGYFGYYNAMQARFDAVNPMTYRASFPSLHVALSSFAPIYTWRFRTMIPFWKPILFIYSVLAVSLWIATIYLRHHWIVDIFAGWVVVAVSVAVAAWVGRFGR